MSVGVYSCMCVCTVYGRACIYIFVGALGAQQLGWQMGCTAASMGLCTSILVSGLQDYGVFQGVSFLYP